MNHKKSETDAWARIAQVASARFLARGYAAVSLRALADELGIKPASLYYHCPGGKAELYARSLEWWFEQYARGLVASAEGTEARDALVAMAEYMLAHPPIETQRIVQVDLPALGDTKLERRVMAALHDAVLVPLARPFEKIAALGHAIDPNVAAAAAMAVVSGLGFAHRPRARRRSRVDPAVRDIVIAALDLLVDGARSR